MFDPWVGKISWRREWLPTPVYPLQYSCLENHVDRGACQGTVHGVAKSWMQLSDTHTSSEKQGFCAVWSAVLQKTLQGFLRDQPLWTSLPHLSLFFLLRLASSWMHDFFLLLKTHLSLSFFLTLKRERYKRDGRSSKSQAAFIHFVISVMKQNQTWLRKCGTQYPTLPCSLFKLDGGPSHDSSSRNFEEYCGPGPGLWNCR